MGFSLYKKEKLVACTSTELLEYIEDLHKVLRSVRDVVHIDICSECHKVSDDLVECEDCKRDLCRDCACGYINNTYFGVEEHFVCYQCPK